MLKKDEKMEKGFKNIIKSKRQPKNLKQILTESKYSRDPETNTVSRRGDKKCLLSQCLIEGNSYTFPNNKTFNIKENMSCQTKYCIYAIKCQCNKNYKGETTNLLKRFNFHKQNEREGSEYEVSKHIKGCGGNLK